MSPLKLTFLYATLFALVVGCGSKTHFKGEEANRRSEGASAPKEKQEDQKPKDNSEKNFNFETVYEKEIVIDTTKSESLSIQLQDQLNSKPFTLQQNVTHSAETKQQIIRANLQDQFVQGGLPVSRTETFTQQQGTAGDLDILVVIDTSGSMVEEQVNLSSKMLPLLSAVQNAKWQIGVVTTDPADPCLRQLIVKGDANASSNFATAINAGASGTGYEQPIRRAVDSLSASCSGSQVWIRPGSTVAVLIVSDEDNCSNGLDAACAAAHRPSTYLTNYLDSIRKLGDTARVYGLLAGNPVCATALNPSPINIQAVTDSSGVWGSICSNDYTATLNQISQNIATILNKDFTLLDAPANVNAVTVKVNGSLVSPANLTLNGKVLTINPAPPVGATIEVTYSVPGTPIFSEVTLSNAAASGTIEVKIDNVTQDASKYSYTAATRKITFVQAPPSSSVVLVKYKQDVALNTKFTFSPLQSSQELQEVQVNQQKSIDYTFNAGTGEVTFNAGKTPLDGSEIKLLRITYGAKQLELAAGIQVSLVAQYKLKDKQSNAQLGATWVNDKVTIAESDFVRNREVVLEYYLKSQKLNSVVLPTGFLKETVTVKIGSTECPANSLVFRSDGFDMNCNYPMSEKVALITYKIPGKHPGVITLEGWEELTSYQITLHSKTKGADVPFTTSGNTIVVGRELEHGEVLSLRIVTK